MAYNKPRRPQYKFEEEEKPKEGETETTTEEGGEEGSTPDTHEQFINILVEMGLSADQAEAVHQMAMDLVNAGGKQEGEATSTEMSRIHRRRALARRARGGVQEREFSRGRFEDRREFSRGHDEVRRPSTRREFHRGERPMGDEFGRSRRPAQRQFGSDNRTAVLLRRQQREIMELKRQLREFGAQPAARPERVRGEFNTQPQEMPTTGKVLDRVKSFLSNHQS